MRDNDIADHTRRVRALLSLSEYLCEFGSWELDRSGRVLYWSEQMSQLHGYPPELHPSDLNEWLSAIADPGRDLIRAEIDDILEGKSDRLEAEYPWQAASDNTVRTFTITGNAVIEDDNIIGIQGIVREAIAGDSARNRSTNRCANLMRHLPAPIAIWKREDDDFILIETNNALNSTSLGRSAKLIGKRAGEIFADRPQILKDMRHCFDTDRIFSREVRDRTAADGITRDYNTNYIPLGDELAIFSVDITSRKEIERILVDSERRYHEFYENSQVGICILDDERRIETANSTILNALGYSLEEMRGRLFLDFVDDAYRTRAKEYVSTLMGSIIPRELSLITKDDTRLFSLVSIRSVGRDDDSVSSLVEISDITTLKQTERNLIALQNQLQLVENEGLKKEAALGAVLDHLESEKQNYQKQIHQRVYRAISPYFEQLKSNCAPLTESDIRQMEDAILTSLENDVDEFEINRNNLSPKEQQICEEIAEGQSSKEIGEKLYLSVETVRKHRKSIRRKLKLTHRGANLTTYLRQRLKSDD